MKKTHQVNIGGQAFIINDDAYLQLKNYLTKLEQRFKEDEATEIIEDIEARVAELLLEQLHARGEKIVHSKMISQVIEVLGDLNEFDEFTETSETPKKRFFRDEDEGRLGGVSYGLGCYFGIDPVIIRAIFALSTLFGGSGLIIYIILWIILPQAKTADEKRQMKGEPLDLSSIEQRIRKETGNLKNNFKSTSNRSKKAVNEISNSAKKLAQAVLKLIGIGFILFGVLVLVSLMATFLTSPEEWNNQLLDTNWAGGNIILFIQSLFESPSLENLFIFGLATLIVVPVLGILLTGLKLFFDIKGVNKTWGLSLSGFFGLGIIALVISGISLAKEFTTQTETETSLGLKATPLLDLTVSSDPFKNKVHSPFFDIEGVEFSESETQFSNTRLFIYSSDIDSNYMVISKSANGQNNREADFYANRINYQILANDSTIEFSPFFTISTEDPYRFQEVNLYLYLREGQRIQFDPNMGRIMYDVENRGNIYDYDMWGKVFEMRNGVLELVESR